MDKLRPPLPLIPRATKIKVNWADCEVMCPKCNSPADGWFVDPRGAKGIECEFCETVFDVDPAAEIFLE